MERCETRSRVVSWQVKFLRVIAYVVRFVENCLRVPRLHDPLTVDKLSDAEGMVPRPVQLKSYRKEVL